MSTEVGRKAVDMFLHLAEGAKSAEFTFTGGEPLTEFSVLQVVTRYAHGRSRDAGMDAHFVLKTNGTILDSAVVDFIKEHAMKVVISIDGTPRVHDEHRVTTYGEATHSLVCNNLVALIENNIPCVASITVHPKASALVLENVRYLHQLGIEYIDIGPVYGTVQWTQDDCRNFTHSLMAVAYYLRETHNKGKRLEVGPLYRESEHVGGILSDYWGCHAVATNLAFAPNGQITGCSALAMLLQRFPELVLGDVFDGLKEEATDNLIQLAQALPEKRARCQECAFSINCTGGCLAINYSTTASALIPPEIYCHSISAIPEAWHKAWQGH